MLVAAGAPKEKLPVIPAAGVAVLAPKFTFGVFAPSGKAAAAGAAGAALAEPKLKPEGCAVVPGLLKEKSPAG